MAEEWSDIRAAAHLWRSRKQEGLSNKEQAEFQAWYDADPLHGTAYAEALLAWESAGLPGFEQDLKAVMAERKARQSPVDETAMYRANPWLGRFVAGATALAASIAIALFAGVPDQLFGPTSPTLQRFASEPGKTQTLSLPDDSRIVLGPDSILEVSMRETERRAELIEGRAFFRVASDNRRPFTVDTSFAEVTVTGTRFDLNLESDALSVAVGEGSVRVKDNEKGSADGDRKTVSLSANQSVRVSDAHGFEDVVEIFPAEFAAWRSGVLVYRDARLRDVVRDLNRYSDLPIELDPNAEDLIFFGTFRTDNMDFVFDAMRRDLSVRVEESAMRVTISKK